MILTKTGVNFGRVIAVYLRYRTVFTCTSQKVPSDSFTTELCV